MNRSQVIAGRIRHVGCYDINQNGPSRVYSIEGASTLQ